MGYRYSKRSIQNKRDIQKMTILQLVTKRQLRGAEVFAATLSEGLCRSGIKVVYVSLYHHKGPFLSVAADEVIDLNFRRWPVVNPLLVISLMRLVNRIKPDIIQANGSDTLKYAVLIKCLNQNVRISYRNISMISAWTQRKPFKKWVTKLLFHHTDLITSVSQQTADDLVQSLSIKESKVKVIHRAIPDLLIDRHGACKQLQLNTDDLNNNFFIIHIGNFSAEKNHEFIIRSFYQFQLHVAHAKLILIGNGPLWEDMKRLTTDLDIASKVVFAGWQQNPSYWLAASDVFVLGSKIEGLPGVLMEAMVQQLPIVSINVGAVATVVKNNITGILIDSYDEALFSSSILKLYNNPNESKKMGMAGRQLVIEQFGVDQCVNKFLNLYNSI